MQKDGSISREASALASQLQKLEQTTQVLQNTMKHQGNAGGLQPQDVRNTDPRQKMQNPTMPKTGINSGTKTSAPGPSQPTKTWTSVAGPSNSQNQTKNEWTLVQPKRNNAPKPRKTNWIILLLDATTRQAFSPLQIRDRINSAFRARGVQGPVVSIVCKTRNDNIAISTIEPYTADFLLDEVNIWKTYAPYVAAQKDEPWFKIMIHGLPAEEFGESADLSSIPEEISIFNNVLKVIGQPY